MNPPRTALVMGGGCAGIAAAVKLADAGVAVTLLETRKRLGGRATSHLDPATGDLIDNCQHVVLGCCTNLLDLYDRLGSSLAIEWHGVMHFADKRGRAWKFAEDPLPPPLHLARAMLGYRGLPVGARLHVARTMSAMIRRRRAEHESQTFGEFLASRRTPRSAIDRFWNPIVRSACNLPVESVSAACAMQVFQQGFMANRAGWRLGVSTVPLGLLYEHTAALIRSAGGVVHTGASIRQMMTEGGRVTGAVTARGETFNADVVISALPADRLDKLVPAHLRHVDARLASLDRIEVSPIIGMHLWLDRPVLSESHVFFADGKIDWLFRGHGEGHVHTGISAAGHLVGMSNDELVDMAMGELRQYAGALPGAGEAKLLRGHVIREKRATIAPMPGFDALRPKTRGRSNLLLAGDWTATGWPSTMEGAVRSGYMAAGAALGHEPGDSIVPDLPIAPLCRLAGLRG